MFLYPHIWRRERFSLQTDWISSIKGFIWSAAISLSNNDGLLTRRSQSVAISRMLTDLCLWQNNTDTLRLKRPTSHCEMKGIQSHAAELKRHAGLREGHPQKSEWNAAIKGFQWKSSSPEGNASGCFYLAWIRYNSFKSVSVSYILTEIS